MSTTSTSHPKQQSHLLTATYTSPTNPPFTHTQTIPSTTPTPSTHSKTTHLRTLRAAREVLQEHINRELTMRMEEDNLRASRGIKGVENEGNGGGGKGEMVDEGKEEENYGEEVVGED